MEDKYETATHGTTAASGGAGGVSKNVSMADYEKAAKAAGWQEKDGVWSHPKRPGQYDNAKMVCENESVKV